MRHKNFKELTSLRGNRKYTITYFQKNKKISRTFSELSDDIDEGIKRLNWFKKDSGLPIVNIAIIGPTSYEWFVLDLACYKGGFRSVAVPETLPGEDMMAIFRETEVDLLLIDFSLKDRAEWSTQPVPYFLFRCTSPDVKDLATLPLDDDESFHYENKLLESHSVAFSSGTSGGLKKIVMKTPVAPNPKISLYKKALIRIVFLLGIGPIVTRKNNKIIIFMPFSHLQQRYLSRQALGFGMNVVISDPINALKHIITEKPNILISVPVFYDVMAMAIRKKIENFSPVKRAFFGLFNKWKINTLSNRNPIKKLFAAALLKDIRKIYGGRGDYFVVGSAAANVETLKIFYSVGVKVYQGYGQSETEIIAMNTEKDFRIGSVGKPKTEIRFSEEGEILIPYRDSKHQHNRLILRLSDDGFIHTGDVGYLDKDGYLFLTGRKDEVLVMKNGKKIFPSTVESKFRMRDEIDQATVFSPDGIAVNVIISLAREYLSLISSESKLNAIIREVNATLESHQRISGYLISSEPFTAENGLMTHTFKPRRSSIIKKFAHEVFKSPA